MSNSNLLAAFLETAWQHLGRGVVDSRSPARYPTFATVSAKGMPEARTVALRRATRTGAFVDVHTDIVTPKVEALKATPHAALHIWLPKAKLQIRMTTSVEIVTGDAVADDWARIPSASRVSYGTQPLPGSPIVEMYDYEKPPLRERFAVLRCWIDHIDLVELADRHRRAEFHRSDEWKGSWCAP